MTVTFRHVLWTYSSSFLVNFINLLTLTSGYTYRLDSFVLLSREHVNAANGERYLLGIRTIILLKKKKT